MPLPALAAGGFLSQVFAYVIGSAIARIVVKVLSAFGVGYLVYTGMDSLITQVQGYLDANLGSLPVSVLQVINIVNIPAAINLILSAYSARYTIGVMNKKLVFNPPGAS